MLKALNKREKIILAVTCAVVVFSLLSKLIIEPVLARNEALNKGIRMTQEKLKKYLRLLSQKEYLKGSYAKISSSVNIPPEGKDDLTGILSEIENLARDANLRIVDMRPQSPKSLSSYKESYLELRAEGDMESCLKFIYNIENSLALLAVKKFQISAKPASSILEASFLISQVSL